MVHSALARMRLVQWAACLSLVALLPACARNPVTGERELMLMSEAQEIQIGQQYDPEIRREMGVYRDEALQRYVDDIFQRLARQSHRPELPWTFTIVDHQAINAFALPGGYIYLTRGILAYLNDESELAGVLGHEIGHVTARHSAQAYSRATGAQLGLVLGSVFFPGARPFGQLAETGLGLLFLRHSRQAELQADRLGAEYAVQTGWDPRGVADLLTTLSRLEEMSRRGIPNWLATHPEPAARVGEITPVIEELRAQTPAQLRVAREEYLRRIDGLLFGDSPEQGIVRGSAFLHPDLRFALRFPEGWEVQNSPTQVLAQQPGERIYMLLQLDERPARNPEEAAARGMRGFRQHAGQRTQINGLDAYVGTYEGQMQGIGRVVTRVAHIAHGRHIYIFGGITDPNLFSRVDQTFTQSIGSFRPMSAAEAAEIRPNRIDLYTVRAGDTWQSIAARAGEGNVPASTLAIMNSHPVTEQPRAGARVKIVVGG
jgi:predicted Zn-dependent protease